MMLYSTSKKSSSVSLKQAVLKGLASDGGLFMPKKFPVISDDFFNRMAKMSFNDISFEVAKSFFAGDIAKSDLRKIIDEAFNFEIVLKKLDDRLFVLELFHGPTLAFKDFAARFMARAMAYYIKNSNKELTILVATSGDTGSAVASGFLKVPGISVVILYPSQRVSMLQEKQLTTMGNNITALEIKGNFDDCQGLVKKAFLDKDINRKLTLASANSINIARLIPQSFYYFYACSRMNNKKQTVFSVPCGNFGNLTAGLIAKRMGLANTKFIAATNINDVVPKYLKTGIFKPRRAKSTLSNAMDISNPSNFARILELYKNDVKKMRNDVVGFSFSDRQTLHAIREAYNNYGYIIEPHTAVAYLGLKHYQKINTRPVDGIFLAAAHPAKFLDIVEKTLKIKIDLPKKLKKYAGRNKRAVLLSNNFKDFKEYLLR